MALNSFIRRKGPPQPLKLKLAKEEGEAEREGHQVDYLPFGVKTVKIEVTGKYRGKLFVSPKRSSSIPGEKFGHEDGVNPPQFVVSWGGGHEDYSELDYPKKRFAYFLVHHVGNGQDNYVLTIDAKDESGEIVDGLPVTLTYPQSAGEPWPKDQARSRRTRSSIVDGGERSSSDLALRPTACRPLLPPATSSIPARTPRAGS